MKTTRITMAMLAVAGTGLLGLPATAQFSEDFDDGGAGLRWSNPRVDAELGVFDGSVDYGTDYSLLGVPSAPNSVGGTTIGMVMEVNIIEDGAVDEGVAVAVVPTVAGATLPAGDYALTMDVYMNVEPTASGTTEFGLFGVHAVTPNAEFDDTLTDDVPFDFGLSNGNGLAWHASGEGGSTNDLHRYEDPGNANAGSQTGLGAWQDIPDGTITGLPTGAATDVGPQGQWVEFEISSTAGLIEWKVNGYTLDSFDNTGGTFVGGTPLIGYADYFNSSSDGRAHYIVFDNINLVPEPASLTLLGLGGLAMLRRRRR